MDDAQHVPVADLGDDGSRPARTRGARVTRLAMGVLVVALVVAGTVVAARATRDHKQTRSRVDPKPDGRVATVDGEQTLVDVEAALAQTVAANTYEIAYRTSATPARSSASGACGGPTGG